MLAGILVVSLLLAVTFGVLGLTDEVYKVLVYKIFGMESLAGYGGREYRYSVLYTTAETGFWEYWWGRGWPILIRNSYAGSCKNMLNKIICFRDIVEASLVRLGDNLRSGNGTGE